MKLNQITFLALIAAVSMGAAAMPIFNYETTPIRHWCVPDQNCNILKRAADAAIDLFFIHKPGSQSSCELVQRWCRRPGQGCLKREHFDVVETAKFNDNVLLSWEPATESKEDSNPLRESSVEANTQPSTEPEPDTESRTCQIHILTPRMLPQKVDEIANLFLSFRNHKKMVSAPRPGLLESQTFW